jgi:succinyl-diaminopimelate desuccinylase
MMNALEQALLERLKASEAKSVAFLQALLRAPSPNPPGDTRPAAALVLGALGEAGFDPTVIAPREDMPNIIARFDGARPGRHLVLNGHIDTFPANDREWERSPYSGDIVDGRIHGRGACDMKGGLASLTLAFLHLHALRDQLRGKLTYTAVSDEETFGPWGARYLFEHHRDLLLGDCLLSGEPSSPECVRFGEKSPYWIAITVRTRGAHGAYTHASASATKIAGQVMRALEELKRLPSRAPDNLVAMFRDPAIAGQVDEGCGIGHSAAIPEITISLGRISGGLKMNMIPGECRLEVDLRLPIGLTKEEVRPQVARLMAQFPDAEWEEISSPEHTPNWSDPDGEMMQILQRTVSDQGRKRPVPVITLGTTDTRLWRFAGMPAYVYGLTPETMAAANENVRVDEFLHVLRVHTLAAARYLTAGA